MIPYAVLYRLNALALACRKLAGGQSWANWDNTTAAKSNPMPSCSPLLSFEGLVFVIGQHQQYRLCLKLAPDLLKPCCLLVIA